MNKDELIEKIKELIKKAEKEFEKSSKNMESFDCGLDVGRLATLQEILAYAEE